MNPFNGTEVCGYYSDFVFNQFVGVGVGQSVMADIGTGDISKFRMTLRHVSPRLCGAKFKTKTAADGSLWVKRVE